MKKKSLFDDDDEQLPKVVVKRQKKKKKKKKSILPTCALKNKITQVPPWRASARDENGGFSLLDNFTIPARQRRWRRWFRNHFSTNVSSFCNNNKKNIYSSFCVCAYAFPPLLNVTF